MTIQRVTKSTLQVLTALADAGEATWGIRIMQATGLQSGTVYQILERLEAGNLVVSEWEPDNDRRGPRRRLYKLTDLGFETQTQMKAVIDGVEAAKALAKNLNQTRHA